jgi:hypothetical protein
MKKLRYGLTLLAELTEFIFRRKVFWLIPVLVVLLPLALWVVGGQVILPLIYTIF